MLASWWKEDLKAWESRTGNRVDVRSGRERSVRWTLNGDPCSASRISDLVYGRAHLQEKAN